MRKILDIIREHHASDKDLNFSPSTQHIGDSESSNHNSNLEQETAQTDMGSLMSSEGVTYNNQNKIVVHCSAGIGRTGTLIAIYNLMHTVRTLFNYITRTNDPFAHEPRISIFGVVRRLREQRLSMVQSQSQYEFIYEYLNQWLIDNNLDKPREKNTKSKAISVEDSKDKGPQKEPETLKESELNQHE